MLLPSGGGDAAAAVVPRPCIWSGMMIRTGCLACLAGLLGWLGWLATGGAAGKTAGQAAGTRHAVSRLFTCEILPDNCF